MKKIIFIFILLYTLTACYTKGCKTCDIECAKAFPSSQTFADNIHSPFICTSNGNCHCVLTYIVSFPREKSDDKSSPAER